MCSKRAISIALVQSCIIPHHLMLSIAFFDDTQAHEWNMAASEPFIQDVFANSDCLFIHV